jgi:hypothetical protein
MAGWAGWLMGWHEENQSKIERAARESLGWHRTWAAEIVSNLNQGFWVPNKKIKIKSLNIFKSNSNWIQNRINSNTFFGKFSNLENWKLI